MRCSHGAGNIPETGPALLVANHVSYIDPLVIMTAQKRRIRFLVWAPYWSCRALRLILRLANVIPIDGTAGPRAIVQSLRTASEALAERRGRVHLRRGGHHAHRLPAAVPARLRADRQAQPGPDHSGLPRSRLGQHLQLPGRQVLLEAGRSSFPYACTSTSAARPLPPTAGAFAVRQAIQQLSAESAVAASQGTQAGASPVCPQAVGHPFRSCIIDPTPPSRSLTTANPGRRQDLLKRLRPVLGDDRWSASGCPQPPATITNICLACLGKTAVNLNYTRDLVCSAIRQCRITKVLTSKLFTHKVPLDPGPGVELIYLEDFRKEITKTERILGNLGVILLPGVIHEYLLMGLGRHKIDDLARSSNLAIVAAVGAAIAALCFVPWEYRVVGKGKLMPIRRRAVFAPENGDVTRIAVIDREKVHKGQLLLTLRDEQLSAEFHENESKLSQALQRVHSFEAQEHIARREDDHTKESQAASDRVKSKTEAEGLQRILKIQRERVESLNVTSPIDGTVAGFQLDQLLQNRPVQQGELLLEVMDETGPWRLELEVEGSRMGHVLRAFNNSPDHKLHVDFIPATAAESTFSGELEEIASRSAVSSDQSNIFECLVTMDGSQIQDKRIGAEVRAKISCGKRSLGYVLFGDVIEFIRQRLWL